MLFDSAMGDWDDQDGIDWDGIRKGNGWRWNLKDENDMVFDNILSQLQLVCSQQISH